MKLKPLFLGDLISPTHDYYSTCEPYSTIKRRLTNRPGQSLSFISYFFDFDSESQSPRISKLAPFLTPNETLALTNLSKQRRVIIFQDVDFYSLSFNLSLHPFESQETLKTNLFTLNSLDDLTSNRIFLFGVNMYLTKKSTGLKYEFEIFTSKQLIKSEPVFYGDNLKINLTFTFNSIELRIGDSQEYLIRLTDKYFNLFIRSLLKAYSSFQLNVTRAENYASNIKMISLANSCMSNFKIATRKLIDEASLKYTHTYYDLTKQTKSLLISKPDKNNLDFDSTCEFNSDIVAKINVVEDEAIPENCYLVTEFDQNENKNIKNVIECECESSLECSYNFWSEKLNKISGQKMEIGFENDEEFRGCVESNEYACFNNGTCVDNYYADSTNRRENYHCLCRDSYTGKRCERYDPCLKNPCSVNATCISKLSSNDQISYECKCFPGFLGRNCTIKFDETCLAKPCMNGATCINITSFDEQTLSYECMCPLGYEGKRCDKKIDYCFLYEPCKNGASCTNKDFAHSSYYECSCAKGWKGVNCTQDIDECASMKSKSITPCSGHGYCLNTPGSYKCNCNELYFGKNCEFVHTCQEETTPCENGGICLVLGKIEENRYSCRCPQGYTGINCSYQTCDSKPCQHNSICSMKNSTKFECNCTNTGYAGQRCENLVNFAECRQQTCFGNMTCDPNKCECDLIDCEKIFMQIKSRPREIVYHLVIWPLLVIMLSLLIILFSIFAMRIKKSRATRGTYSPSRHEQQASRIEFNMDLKIPPEERLI
ncbi:unnamed protein product [Brachionus calyciflorus]|uniref:EGF-like domain-containing protein n=1 Tax=Brachionus calyciflorus TaxID=104777 RepID=A0A813M0U1_9BILA|nr:unnamed protein product [Brachionus calyciflorus]